MLKDYRIALIALGLLAPAPGVLAEIASAGTSCAANDGHECTFQCSTGDVISVAGSSASGGKIGVTGSCGGQSAQCNGVASCSGTSTGAVLAAGSGICGGTDTPGNTETYSCAAGASSADAFAALVALGAIPGPTGLPEET